MGPSFEGVPVLYDANSPLEDATGLANPARAGLWNRWSNFSRVIEFNPMTLEVVWQYSQPNPTADLDGDGRYLGNERLFYSFFISSAQRLLNGNTMITEGATGRVFEVTPKNQVVWEYMNPFRSAGGAGVPLIVGTVYRAYRVPYWWAPKNRDCTADSEN